MASIRHYKNMSMLVDHHNYLYTIVCFISICWYRKTIVLRPIPIGIVANWPINSLLWHKHSSNVIPSCMVNMFAWENMNLVFMLWIIYLEEKKSIIYYDTFTMICKISWRNFQRKLIWNIIIPQSNANKIINIFAWKIQ